MYMFSSNTGFIYWMCLYFSNWNQLEHGCCSHYQKTDYPWGPAISLRGEIKPPRIYNYFEGCIKPPRKCIFLSAKPNRQVKSIFPWVLVETAKVILCFLECYYKPPNVINISLGVTRNRQGSFSFFGCKLSSKLLQLPRKKQFSHISLNH